MSEFILVIIVALTWPVFIYILLYFLSRKKEKIIKKMINEFTNLFPGYNIKILRESGVIADPHIVAEYKNEDVEVIVRANFITFRRGKHFDHDLFLSLLIEKDFTPMLADFQETQEIKIMREGWALRLLGGENVELEYPELDEKLYIKAEKPEIAKQFLLSHLYLIKSIPEVNGLEKAILRIDTERFFIKYRLEAIDNDNAIVALNQFRTILVNLLGEETVRRHDMDKKGSRSFITPLKLKTEQVSAESSELLEPAFEMLRYQAQSVVFENQNCVVDTFLRLFDKITFQWSDQNLSAYAPVNINKDINCSIRLQRIENVEFNWNFDNVEIDIQPNELKDNLDTQLEIGRYLSKFEGPIAPLLTLQVNKGQGQLRIESSRHPKNVQVMFDLIKSIDWFIDISFV